MGPAGKDVAGIWDLFALHGRGEKQGVFDRDALISGTVPDKGGRHMEGNLLFQAQKLQKLFISACHIFTGGAHGISMCTQEVETPNPDAQKWVELCDTWLNDRFEFTP